jgi:hypothetical protein
LLVVCKHHQLAYSTAAAGRSGSGSAAAACAAVAALLLLVSICCCCVLEPWQLLHKLHHSPHLGLTCMHSEQQSSRVSRQWPFSALDARMTLAKF